MELHIGEYVDGTLLRWSESYVCAACGGAIEGDGMAPLPEYARRELLETHGEWALQLSLAGPGGVRALKVLRRELKLSVPEVAALRARLSGSVLTGTRGEMERLRRLLVAEGVDASISSVI